MNFLNVSVIFAALLTFNVMAQTVGPSVPIEDRSICSFNTIDQSTVRAKIVYKLNFPYSIQAGGSIYVQNGALISVNEIKNSPRGYCQIVTKTLSEAISHTYVGMQQNPNPALAAKLVEVTGAKDFWALTRYSSEGKVARYSWLQGHPVTPKSSSCNMNGSQLEIGVSSVFIKQFNCVTMDESTDKKAFTLGELKSIFGNILSLNVSSIVR